MACDHVWLSVEYNEVGLWVYSIHIGPGMSGPAVATNGFSEIRSMDPAEHERASVKWAKDWIWDHFSSFFENPCMIDREDNFSVAVTERVREAEVSAPAAETEEERIQKIRNMIANPPKFEFVENLPEGVRILMVGYHPFLVDDRNGGWIGYRGGHYGNSDAFGGRPLQDVLSYSLGRADDKFSKEFERYWADILGACGPWQWALYPNDDSVGVIRSNPLAFAKIGPDGTPMVVHGEAPGIVLEVLSARGEFERRKAEASQEITRISAEIEAACSSAAP